MVSYPSGLAAKHVSTRIARCVAVFPAGAMAISLVGGAPAFASYGPARPGGNTGPTRVPLPDGFAPKDIAIGGMTAYVGSRANGSIERVNVLTGQTAQLSPATGEPAVGIAGDNCGRLFVGDGPRGDARVLDTRTGTVIRTYTFGVGAFLSDAFYGEGAVWFIDAYKPVLYELPIGPGGQLPSKPVTIPISGGGFKAADTPNGVTQTPDGRALLVGTTNSGGVFRIDPRTGAATRVRLDDFTLSSPLTGEDALHVAGDALYVAENTVNAILTYRLNSSGTSGQLVTKTTNAVFDGPSDFAFSGSRVWVVNSREASTKITPTTAYNLASIPDPAIWPTEFQLPNGFEPDEITIGSQPYAYFGSVTAGSIYRVDLRTGLGRTVSVAPGLDYASVGLKIDDRGRIFVAGGYGTHGTGQARVIDSRTGKILKSYTFVPNGTQSYANNVLVADNAAWFTDSFMGVLWKLPLGPGGQLPAKAQAVTLAGGGFKKSDLIDGISTTPDGRGIIVDADSTGQLYEVDPGTGATRLVQFIGMSGKQITTADGLLLEGNTLYVADRVANRFWVFTLNHSGTTARYDMTLTDSRFQGSSALAAYGNRLYVPDSKGTHDVTPTTPYDAVSVPMPAISAQRPGHRSSSRDAPKPRDRRLGR
jgi:sugar lactone lactonase YvrE